MNGTIPATVNSSEGSGDTNEALGTTVWPRSAKCSRKRRRISAVCIRLYFNLRLIKGVVGPTAAVSPGSLSAGGSALRPPPAGGRPGEGEPLPGRPRGGPPRTPPPPPPPPRGGGPRRRAPG